MYKQIFISHKYSGLSDDELQKTLLPLKEALSAYAESVFCSYEHIDWMEENKMSPEENYARCLERQRESDCVVAFLHYPERSRGMDQELALAKELGQRYVLLEREVDPKPEFYEIYEKDAESFISYSEFSELLTLLLENGVI